MREALAGSFASVHRRLAKPHMEGAEPEFRERNQFKTSEGVLICSVWGHFCMDRASE